MKRLRIAAVILLICLLSGCGDFFYPMLLPEDPLPSAEPTPGAINLPPQKPDVHTFGIPYYPVESFHPLTDAYRHNGGMARLCYEGLIELDANFEPQYLLASDIQTTDNITYTVTLNASARFWNDEPVRPEDVKHSYDLAQSAGGLYAERLRGVRDVAVSGGSVAITMNGPVFNAAALFDVPIVQSAGERQVAVGTGPYTIHLSGSGSFLLQNESWWRSTDLLPVSRIELVPARVPGDLVMGFGQTYISLMPLDIHDTLAPGVKGLSDRTRYPTPAMQYIGFNMSHAALRNPEVRRALSMSFDRKGISEELYGPLADAATLPVPPASALYLDLPGAVQYNPQGAGRLLDEQGFSWGTGRFRYMGKNPFTLRFIVDSGSDKRVQAAKAYAQALRTLGVYADVQILGWDAFLAAIDGGDYDIYYAEALLLPNFSPRSFLAEGGALNSGGFSSAEMNEALWALETAPDSGREAALTEVWRIFYEQAPAIIVCFRQMQLFSQSGLIEGLSPTYYNPYHGWKDLTIQR